MGGIFRNGLLIMVVLAILTAVGVAAWKANSGGGEQERRGREIPVQVAKVDRGDFVDRLEAIGTANSNESIIITAKVTDTVSKIRFEDGQLVEQGDILVEMTSEEESAALEEAEASLREAERNYRRIANLVNSGTATRARLEEALSMRDQARARVNAIQARLSDRLITAPFSGLLGLRLISPGTLLTPTTAITTLDDISVIKADFDIPETFLSAVSPGQTVEARASAFPGEIFTGEITVVDTRVNPRTRAVTVRAQIPNADNRLRPGMLLSVFVLKNPRVSLRVPEDAIVPLGSKTYVYTILEDMTANRIAVEIGTRYPGWAEILSGLEEGQEVIVGGTNRVRPGATVKVVEVRDGPAAARTIDD